jgi:hypothetical protein
MRHTPSPARRWGYRVGAAAPSSGVTVSVIRSAARLGVCGWAGWRPARRARPLRPGLHQEPERGNAPVRLPVRLGRSPRDAGLVAPGLSDLAFGRSSAGLAGHGGRIGWFLRLVPRPRRPDPGWVAAWRPACRWARRWPRRGRRRSCRPGSWRPVWPPRRGRVASGHGRPPPVSWRRGGGRLAGRRPRLATGGQPPPATAGSPPAPTRRASVTYQPRMVGLLVAFGDALVGQRLAQPGMLVVHGSHPFLQLSRMDRGWLRMGRGRAVRIWQVPYARRWPVPYLWSLASTVPVSLWPGAGDNPGEMGGRVASPTFVGRAEELSLLEAAQMRAADGEPAVVLVGVRPASVRHAWSPSWSPAAARVGFGFCRAAVCRLATAPCRMRRSWRRSAPCRLSLALSHLA